MNAEGFDEVWGDLGPSQQNAQSVAVQELPEGQICRDRRAFGARRQRVIAPRAARLEKAGVRVGSAGGATYRLSERGLSERGTGGRASVKALNDRERRALSSKLGATYAHIGDFPAALEQFRGALDLDRRLGSTLEMARTQTSIGLIMCYQHQHLEAIEQFQAARAAFLASGVSAQAVAVEAITVTLGLGRCYTLTARFDEADTHLKDALEESRSLHDKLRQRTALYGLGLLEQARGRLPEARTHLEMCAAIARRTSDLVGEAETLTVLAEVNETLGDTSAALSHLKRARMLERELSGSGDARPSRFLFEHFRIAAVGQDDQIVHRINQELMTQMADRARTIEAAQLEALERLTIAAERRDDDTGSHTKRVGKLSARIAEVLGCDPEEVRLMALATPLHDVGKIGLPDSILLKRDQLSSQERQAMQLHTLIAGQILGGSGSALIRKAEEIALSHHERWDGTGYPFGLARQEIPLLGRIVAVADVFDALIHTRPYNPAWTPDEALREIRRSNGSQFDPAVVDAFERVLASEPAWLEPS